MLLGRDIGNLLELAVREQEAYAVLTRIQRRKKEKEEAAALAKEITSGVKPRPLTTESEEENEESVVLNRLYYIILNLPQFTNDLQIHLK